MLEKLRKWDPKGSPKVNSLLSPLRQDALEMAGNGKVGTLILGPCQMRK